MSRIAYVNGRYLPHGQARVHVEDRGYQFSDGVYEVCEVRDRHVIDMAPHVERLDRSLRELRIAWPVSKAVLPVIVREVIRRNGVANGLVYLQATRGVARRDHPFPVNAKSALVVTAKATDRAKGDAKRASGSRVITLPDNRWERVDIKTVGLLPNVLARQAAIEAGADEAWFVGADGIVREGAATNAWIVKDGRIATRPAESGILRGITRTTVLRVARGLGMEVEERGFTVDEAKAADEAFNTAASTVVMPVIAIDGEPVGEGRPGPVTSAIRDAFHGVAERTAA